jgi:DnaJ-class molecular chaperone
VKTCPDCNGDGVIEKGTDDEQQCPRCGGSGFVPDDDNDEEVTRTDRKAIVKRGRQLVHSTLLVRYLDFNDAPA